MSFLDKFKGKGRDADRRDDDLASMFDEVIPVRPDDMVLAFEVSESLTTVFSIEGNVCQ